MLHDANPRCDAVLYAFHVLACIHGPMGFHWYSEPGIPSAKGAGMSWVISCCSFVYLFPVMSLELHGYICVYMTGTNWHAYC